MLHLSLQPRSAAAIKAPKIIKIKKKIIIKNMTSAVWVHNPRPTWVWKEDAAGGDVSAHAAPLLPRSGPG